MAHDPAWPDKAMFAAYLLIIGGALGLAIEGLRAVGTVEEKLPPALADAYPHWVSAAMSAVTLVLGVFCLRTQAAVYGYLGAATGFGSLAYAGLVPFLAVLAIAMLIKSKLEGEETINDGIILHPTAWPDKAMAASLFLVVAATVLLVQGVAILRGDYEPILLAKIPGLVLDFAGASVLLVSAYLVYHLRMPWMGDVGGWVAILSFGLYLLGPALGITALIYMALARRENEFTPERTGSRRSSRARKSNAGTKSGKARKATSGR